MTATYTQSEDFREESISLYEILKNEKEEVFNIPKHNLKTGL